MRLRSAEAKAGRLRDPAMQERVERIVAAAKPYTSRGSPASYIPALAAADPRLLGMSVLTVTGERYGAGDNRHPFTMQSISKVFALACVLRHRGEKSVFARVDREPSGDPFYSLVLLEGENGRPRNPMINAGAIVISSLLPGRSTAAKFRTYTRFLRTVSPDGAVRLDRTVYGSEFRTGQRNRALANLMGHFGTIDGPPDSAVDAYFRQCSVLTTCDDLARLGAFLADHGVDPLTRTRIVSPTQCRSINALMATCGLYDESGEFAARVGLPGKSGVGGGILAIVPGRMSIAVFGPALDPRGSSVAGFRVLELFAAELGLSLYG